MNIIKVQGKNREHRVFLYALSTCAWCKLTKRFLKDNDIEYEYVDVDLLESEDKEKIKRDILNRGGSLSYPLMVIDDKTLINGFRRDKLKETLGL